MKKLVVAILAILYLSTSTGATLHMHYCMGKLAEWGFGQDDAKKCSKCGMEKGLNEDNGCCRDEQKFLKNESDQKTTQQTFQTIQLIAIALPSSFIEFTTLNIPSVTEENPVGHAPPLIGDLTLYIRNCVFLI